MRWRNLWGLHWLAAAWHDVRPAPEGDLQGTHGPAVLVGIGLVLGTLAVGKPQQQTDVPEVQAGLEQSIEIGLVVDQGEPSHLREPAAGIAKGFREPRHRILAVGGVFGNVLHQQFAQIVDRLELPGPIGVVVGRGLDGRQERFRESKELLWADRRGSSGETVVVFF